MSNRTQDQIIADMRALAKLPTVYATSMITAQSYRATPEVRDGMLRRANLTRELLDTTDKQNIRLTVRTVAGEVLGHLTYSM